MNTRDLRHSLSLLRALTVEELLALREAVETALAEKRGEIERDLARISVALAQPVSSLSIPSETLH
jgi:hypothetical protein